MGYKVRSAVFIFVLYIEHFVVGVIDFFCQFRFMAA